jgi:hypothetical protein
VVHRQTLSGYSVKKGFQLHFLQPSLAWIVILTLVLLTVLCIFVGVGKILNFAFPAGALAVGLFLYFRYPILYIGFSWWMWFLTPFVRRLADYRSGFTEPSPLLFAPYLVTAITLITVFQHFPQSRRDGNLPFIIPLAGIFYAFLIGLVNRTPFEVTRYFLDWMCPLTFGFHLVVNWRDFLNYHQNLQRTFLWGVLVMGIYGIFQYVVAPEWDQYWLIETGLISSQGLPVPFGMRVWSTMSSVEPFAAVMAAGLLLLFSQTGILNICASVTGYLAILLSIVRSAWLGWLAGVVTLGFSLNAKQQMRLMLIVIVLILLVIPLTSIEPFSTTITQRLQTLSDVKEDGSFQGRSEYLNYMISSGKAFSNFLGDGISSTFYDNGFLATLLQLGWFGTICYVSGMFVLIWKLFQDTGNHSNFFTGTARAIVVSCLVRIPANPSAIVGVGGMLFWGFLALNVASQKYYQHQRTM